MFANSSERFSYSEIIFSSSLILSSLEEKPKVLQAFFADATARSIYSLAPAYIVPTLDSSYGLITSIFSEPNGSTHSPFI